MEKGDKSKTKEEPSGSGGHGSGVKRKKVYNVEPRTPLKRQRIPVARFQSPVLEEGTPKPKPPKEEIVILYKKGVFLAVRGAENSIYLCKTQQNVHSTSRQFRIQWLNLDQPPNIYKMDYIDHTDIECVLTNVRMERIARDTLRLPHSEQDRAEKILQKAVRVERGETIEEEEEPIVEEVIEEEEDVEEWEEEPAPKKTKHAKGKAKATRKTKSMKIALTKGKKTKQSGQKKEKDKKKDKSKEKKKKEEKKKGPDRKLKPNPKIKVLEKSLFFESKDKIPFISTPVKTRQVFRAVLLNDKELLQSLISSEKDVYRLDVIRSVENHVTAIDYAIEKGNKDMVKMLIEDILNPKNKRHEGGPPTCLLKTADTGSYNPTFLGIRNVRALNMSRGSREGNDAFAKDLSEDNMNMDYVLESLLKRDADPNMLEVVMAANPDPYETRDNMMQTMFENIHTAVQLGNRKLAGKLVADAEKAGGHGFNFLHKEVLNFDKEDLRANILPVSVRKKPYGNGGMTPLHCAAINPNVKYLSRLLQIEPDINLMDKSHRRPIHYAAACQGSGPLELLLERGASMSEIDSQGNTPLHFACRAGRAQNVDILLKKAKINASAMGDVGSSKWGVGGINRPNRFSICPIHDAIYNGHTEVVKILSKHGADLNKQLSAGKQKKSPLMLAAERGNLDIARLLVQNGATVELLDKLKKSALTHAILNGNSNVASYLLYLGADPNRADSSGNTLVHYAAAYGWYFCLKMLISDCGADANKPNGWNTTPVAIAFLKGHMGIVSYLLNQPGVDINFKDDDGLTLTSTAAGSLITKSLLSQVEYLVKEKKADPTICDNEGRNALHHLAANNIKLSGVYHKEVCETAMDISVKIAECLIDAGCDPTVRTVDGKTPVMLAIEKVNSRLVRFLVEKGGTVSPEKNSNHQNVLHLMAEQCMTTDLAPLIEILADHKVMAAKKSLKKVTSKTEAESMEVDDVATKDGNEVNDDKPAEVNGEKEGVKDGGEKPAVTDLLQKVNGEIGDEPMQEVVEEENVLKKMAPAIDKNGMTPLLRACYMYKTFEKKRQMNDTTFEKLCQQGRDFIRAMIDLAGCDVNKAVEKKYFEGTMPVYTNESSYYVKEAKYTSLHMMVEAKNEKPVERDGVKVTCPGLQLILKYKPKLEQRNLNDKTALALAVDLGMEEMLKMLLKSGADPNISSTTVAEVPILCAARNHQENLLKLLVDAKANVNVCNKKTLMTPLHYIVQKRGNEASTLSMVQTLVGAGADINAVDDHKRTVFHLAINSNSGTSNASTDLEEFLIEKGANVFSKDVRERLPLHYTFVKIGNHTNGGSLDPIELCSLLTSVMGGKNLDDADAFGQTPLHCAAVRGATICCMHLLQRKAEIGKKDHSGNTPLSLAVNNRHDSCAIMLIQKGASVRDHIVIPQTTIEEKPENDKKKRPVLSWRPLVQWEQKIVKTDKITYPIFQGAISSELQGVAHIILDTAGMDFSAVESALSVHKYNVVLRLMKRIPDASRLHTINEEGRNLFHMLVLKATGSGDLGAQLKVAQALRDKGVSVGLRDKHGCTPLHYAAMQHEPQKLGQFLIDNDPALDLKSKDKLGRDVLSAYMWDLNGVDTNWLKMLLEKGATFDVRYDRPLPDPLLLGTSIPSKCPNYFTMKGDVLISPLILAIHYFKFGLVSFMLNNGASPNFEDSLRRTPLMHAARRNDVAITKLLLNFSYDPTSGPKEAGTGKLTLSKSLSRTVFMLRPDGSMSGTSDFVAEDDEQDASVDENEEEENENEEEEGGSEGGDEEPVEEDPVDEEDEPVEEEEEEPEEEPEEDVEDSDHDTDVMDEEEEEENSLVKQKSILSKQLSLRKQGTSLTRKDEFPTVDKTSSVDLDAADIQGWTVIHHLVSPLELGTFDQEEVLFVLAKAGASLDKKDNGGLSPLDYALIRGAPKIASRLQKLLKSEKDEKPTLTSFEVNDGILSDGVKVDFKADYDKMIEKLNEEAMDVNSGEDKFGVKPDKFCNIKNSCEVVQDSKQNIPFDILLSKVDVSCGTWGMFNFYKMQIVYQKSKDLYVLFTRWGRIGDQGQYQHTPFQKKEDVVKEYCKIFRSKTGNDWSNVSRYVNHPKKYRLVPREQKYDKVHQVRCSLTSDVPSKLPLPLQDLVKEMSSDTMLEASIKKVGMNTDYMPFGHIKKDALLEARTILTQIGELIEATEKQRKNMLSTDMELYQANCEKISKLSNDYYHLVPSHGFEYEAIRPISEKDMLKNKIRFLSDMLDIEIASRILLGSQMHLKDMNPLDYIYRAIGCQIEPLPAESLEAQYILTYIRASYQGSAVHSIYKLSRSGEEEQLRSLNMDNHCLLWHGSSMSNFISILHRGLLIAPPEVPITGHLFGEGIYFADTFSKSRLYSYNCNPGSDAKLMLLCQVALGKQKEDVSIDDDDHLDPDINSLKILGRQQPSPEYNISMPFGTSMPLGRTTPVEHKPAPHMPHNEFIVYDSSQVCVRYLVMFSN